MINKIVSGGQTGADQAGLDVGIKLGISHGGWIPKGRKTENGKLPDRYKLREMAVENYAQRTKQNVLDSDGTLIFSHGQLTGGSELTRIFTVKHGKPCLHIDLNSKSNLKISLNIDMWIRKNNIRVLNVAGPRASKDPKIYKAVFKLLERSLTQI